MNGILFCFALKKICTNLKLPPKNKLTIVIKHGKEQFKRMQSKSESEIHSEVIYAIFFDLKSAN